MTFWMQHTLYTMQHNNEFSSPPIFVVIVPSIFICYHYYCMYGGSFLVYNIKLRVNNKFIYLFFHSIMAIYPADKYVFIKT